MQNSTKFCHQLFTYKRRATRRNIPLNEDFPRWKTDVIEFPGYQHADLSHSAHKRKENLDALDIHHIREEKKL